MIIAIKLPDEPLEILLSFPVLKLLSNEFEKRKEKALEDEQDYHYEIHLMVIKEYSSLLKLLPFDASYHEFEKDDLKNIFNAHRALMNFKIETVDSFYSLTDGFVDASMGKNLKARRIIGYESGKNKLFLKQKIRKLSTLHKSDDFLRIFQNELYNYEKPFYLLARELPVLEGFEEKELIVINLDVKNGDINNEWVEYFDYFENNDFVLLCSDLDLNHQAEYLVDFIKKLPNKNNYHYFEVSDHLKFARMMKGCKWFITPKHYYAHLATLCRCDVYMYGAKDFANVESTQYFLGEYEFVKVEESLQPLFDFTLGFLLEKEEENDS